MTSKVSLCSSLREKCLCETAPSRQSGVLLSLPTKWNVPIKPRCTRARHNDLSQCSLECRFFFLSYPQYVTSFVIFFFYKYRHAYMLAHIRKHHLLTSEITLLLRANAHILIWVAHFDERNYFVTT